jgi:GNAT superfamily N-acetyltransferase
MNVREIQAVVLAASNPSDPDDHYGTVTVSNWDDGIIFYMLFVPKKNRRKGYANKLIDRVKDMAKGRPVYLQVEPFADGSMGFSRLESFYRRCGFRKVGESAGNYRKNLMVWYPKQRD